MHENSENFGLDEFSPYDLLLVCIIAIHYNINVKNIQDDEIVLITQCVYDKHTGLPRRQETRDVFGRLQSPPNDLPSVILYRGGVPYILEWHEDDVEHRENGPSSIVMYTETGQSMTEIFCFKGAARPQTQGPFRIYYDEETGARIAYDEHEREIDNCGNNLDL